MSNLTLEPRLVTAAKLFLSSLDWPRTKTLKQARTNTILSMEGRCLVIFMKSLPYRQDADGQEWWIKGSLHAVNREGP
jgi:hypothetical protein